MQRLVATMSTLGVWLALLGIAGAVAAPIGFRLGVWDFAFALRKVLAFAIIACVLGLLLCLAAWIGSKVFNMQLHARVPIALLLSGLLCAYVLWQVYQVRSLPMIHDITTDWDNPPAFVALAEARKAAPNGLVYRGAELAAQQRQAYPDIAPIHSSLAPAALFARAESAARTAGWHIVAAQPQQGRIEATAASLLFGFKDDIVIRIRPSQANTGSVLDVRSMSRVGISDLGVNAKRIRALGAALRDY
jgi:uncharacterized protein (DUF1499 family)